MPIITIDVKYYKGQIVYLKTDIDQKPRIVTGYLIEHENLLYNLSCGTEYTRHFGFEISEYKDYKLS